MVRQTIDVNIIPDWRGLTIEERQKVVDPKLPLFGIFGNPIDELKRKGDPINPDNVVKVFQDESLLRFRIVSVDWVNLKAELDTFGEVDDIDRLALCFCFYTDDWMERDFLRSKLTGVVGGYFALKEEQEELSKIPGTEVGGVIR